MIDSSEGSHEARRLTRRQFGCGVAALSTTAVLGMAGAGGWMWAKHKLRANLRLRYENSIRPDLIGANSLGAHAAAKGLMYGSAVFPERLDVEGIAKGHTADSYTQLVAAQAGILVAGNAMKWDALRPSADRFDFTVADRMMRFAQLTGKRVRGHNLCWHRQLPGWFRSTANKDNARQLLTSHIREVVEHFRGRIHSWDVVNEAIEEAVMVGERRPDGLRVTPWLELIGPDYIELAFRTAAEADPQAKLTYNDYEIETDRPAEVEKRAKVVALLRGLKERGVPIHAVGVQSHLHAALPKPGAGLQSFIREAAAMGLEVYVTELDVNCGGVEGGVEERDAVVARIYKDYLDLVLAEPNVPLVLTWGLMDEESWLRYGWQIDDWDKRSMLTRFRESRRQRPLPFDDEFAPTPAFWSLRGALDGAHPAAAASMRG